MTASRLPPPHAAQPAFREPLIRQVEVGLLQNFCTLICDPVSGGCAVVDPAFEVDRICRQMDDDGVRPTAVWLTHTHFDHIEGVPTLLARLPPTTPVFVGAAEADAVRSTCLQAGVTAAIEPLHGGETLRLGSLQVQVLATPGHTPAGRSFYLPDLGAVITGDTLFIGSCGRPAAPHTVETLWRSLGLLADLPEETRIYPGHDYGATPTSTIGWERERNPYLRCADAASFAALTRSRIGRG